MFKSACKMLIDQIFATTQGADTVSWLTKDLKTYDTGLYNLAKGFSSAIAPVAMALLGLFVMMEFLKISQKCESGGMTMGLEPFIPLAIKIGFVQLFVGLNASKLPDFLNGIMGIASDIITKLDQTAQNPNVNALSKQGFYDVIDSSKLGGQIFGAIMLLLVVLLTTAVIWGVKLMFALRFVELYILMSIAPLAFSPMVHEEFSSVTKGFVKLFCSKALQGIILFIMMVFYPLVSRKINNASGTSIASMSIALSIGVIILGVMAFKANSIAKSVLGAM